MNAITINGTTWQHCSTCAAMMRPDGKCPSCSNRCQFCGYDNIARPCTTEPVGFCNTAINRYIREAK